MEKKTVREHAQLAQLRRQHAASLKMAEDVARSEEKKLRSMVSAFRAELGKAMRQAEAKLRRLERTSSTLSGKLEYRGCMVGSAEVTMADRRAVREALDDLQDEISYTVDVV